MNFVLKTCHTIHMYIHKHRHTDMQNICFRLCNSKIIICFQQLFYTELKQKSTTQRKRTILNLFTAQLINTDNMHANARGMCFYILLTIFVAQSEKLTNC